MDKLLLSAKNYAKENGLHNLTAKQKFGVCWLLSGLPEELADEWYDRALELGRRENHSLLFKRVNELLSGDIGLDDFADGEDLADYLLDGDQQTESIGI